MSLGKVFLHACIGTNGPLCNLGYSSIDHNLFLNFMAIGSVFERQYILKHSRKWYETFGKNLANEDGDEHFERYLA